MCMESDSVKFYTNPMDKCIDNHFIQLGFHSKTNCWCKVLAKLYIWCLIFVNPTDVGLMLKTSTDSDLLCQYSLADTSNGMWCFWLYCYASLSFCYCSNLPYTSSSLFCLFLIFHARTVLQFFNKLISCPFMFLLFGWVLLLFLHFSQWSGLLRIFSIVPHLSVLTTWLWSWPLF